MKRAGAIYKVAAIHTDHFSPRKNPSNDVDCDLIRRMPIRWNEHRMIANVEIRVTGGEPSFLSSDEIPHRRRHRQFHDMEWATVLVL